MEELLGESGKEVGEIGITISCPRCTGRQEEGWKHQEDSGMAGAAFLAFAAPEGSPISLHTYGRDGVRVEHLELLRAMAPKRKFTLMELHYSHPQNDQNQGDRPEIYTAAGGAYCRHMALHAERLGMATCMFTARDFYKRDGSPHESLFALTGKIKARPMVRPTGLSDFTFRKMGIQASKGMRTASGGR